MKTNIKIKLLENLLAEVTKKYDEFIKSQEDSIQRELKRAITDPLTQIYNREYLKRYGENLFKKDGYDTLILIDLDNFKGVNDKLGHKEGDDVLKRIADILKNNFKDEKLVRYGGDEFIIITKSGTKIKNRLKKARKEIEEHFENFGISFSYGLAKYDSDGIDIDNLMLIADERMYKNKKERKENKEIDDNRLISFISYIPIVTLVLFLLINGAYEFYSQYDFYQKKIEMSKKNFLQKQKEIIKSRVDFIINTIEYKRKKLPQDRAKKELIDYINSVKFTKTEYIFIYELLDINGGKKFAKMIANPNRKDLIGRYISDDYKDAKGNMFRKEFLKEIKKSGESFTIYYYKKPNSNKIAKKISYFKLYKDWNWIVATGIYLDKEKEIVEIENNSLKKLLIDKMLSSIITSIIILIIALYVSSYLKKLFLKRFDSYKKDIKQNEKELELKNRLLSKQLFSDQLTKKFNRNALERDLKRDNPTCMTIVDIDNFRWLNDLYGTKNGNIILKSTAEIIENFKNEQGLEYKTYRIGSDQFVLVTDMPIDKDRALYLTKKLQRYITSQKIHLNQNDWININATIGISCKKDDLLSTADMALNRAKATNRKIQYFIEDIDRRKKNLEIFELKKDLDHALIYDEIVPFFQPITDCNKNIVKYECLVRICKAKKNDCITPGRFLEISKILKLYSDISESILSKSFEFFKDKEIEFSINISTEDIKNNSTYEMIKEYLKNYPNLAKRTTIEILESDNIDDISIFNKFIEEMKNYEVKIAIDDFGSGYSTFSNLLIIKPDILKIDATLIKNIDKDRDKQEIVKAIIATAKILGSTTIAEYVSSKEIFDKCLELGVDQFQGYYLGKPAPDLVS